MNKLKKGFTLLELLIVIVILGLLVSLVSINVLPALNQAYLEKAKADISRLEQALVMYKINERTNSKPPIGFCIILIPDRINNNPKYIGFLENL